jgi:drug/metabolite transporter (DMT)-like permease
MLEGARPEAGSTLASDALGCAWAALVLLPLARLSHDGPARLKLLRDAPDWRGLLAGALLFGGPASALLIGAKELDAGAMVMALALTPVAVAVAAATTGAARPDGVPGRIWPGLAAVAGLLLLLPEPSLGAVRGDVAMLLAPALTGAGAALFCAEPSAYTIHAGGLPAPTAAFPRPTAPFPRPTAALAGGAVLFAVAVAMRWLVARIKPVVTLSAVACDGIVALLAVLALSRLPAARWSAQFVLVPLLILLEGIMLARPGMTARWLFGLGLLALAGVYLLLPAVDESEDGAAFVPR